MKYSLKSLVIVYRYAAQELCVQGLLLVLQAAGITGKLLLVQRLADSVAGALRGGVWSPVVVNATLFAGITAILVLATWLGKLTGTRLDSRLALKLSPVVVDKFIATEFACFEDSGIRDCIKQMSENPAVAIKNVHRYAA